MPGSNGAAAPEPHSATEGLLSRLGELADEFPAAIADLERQRDEIDAQIKRLRRTSKLLTDQPAAATGRPAKAYKKYSVANRAVLKVADIIKSIDTERFTIQDIRAIDPHTPKLADNTIRNSVKRLREIEFLGKVGLAPPDGGGGRGREMFRILDADALDALEV